MDEKQLGQQVYSDLNALSWDEIERYTANVWPVLLRLTADERQRLRRGLLDGTLRDVEETRGKHSTPNPVEGAALWLMRRYAPKNAGEFAAYLAVLIALLAFLRGSPDPAPLPPPVTVVIKARGNSRAWAKADPRGIGQWAPKSTTENH